MTARTAMPPQLTVPPRAALLAFVLAALSIGGAWFSQLVLDMPPCELCLLERWPYYVGLPIALIAVIVTRTGRGAPPRLSILLLTLIALVFLVSAGLGIYHAGVEWHFWPGPEACTGQYSAAGSTNDFLKSLEAGPVVRCDAAATRILGLSLAGWNAVVSLVIAAAALIGVRALRR